MGQEKALAGENGKKGEQNSVVGLSNTELGIGLSDMQATDGGGDCFLNFCSCCSCSCCCSGGGSAQIESEEEIVL